MSSAGNHLRSGGLWSLWDMLRVYANAYVNLGMYIHDEFAGLFFNDPDKDTALKPRTEKQNAELKAHLEVLITHRETLKLDLSKEMIRAHLNNLPQTSREFQILVGAMLNELKGRLFLHVPPHRAAHHESEISLSEPAKKAFPSAISELRAARNRSVACHGHPSMPSQRERCRHSLSRCGWCSGSQTHSNIGANASQSNADRCLSCRA